MKSIGTIPEILRAGETVSYDDPQYAEIYEVALQTTKSMRSLILSEDTDSVQVR